MIRRKVKSNETNWLYLLELDYNTLCVEPNRREIENQSTFPSDYNIVQLNDVILFLLRLA